MDICELASAVIASEELVLIRADVPEKAPDSNRKTGSFEPVEGVKDVLVDPKGWGTRK